MGLRHADSISGYRAALEGDLYGTRASDLIVLKFGQVDADFVYYLKLVDAPSLSFEAFAAESVRKYFSFVDDALASLPVTREQLRIMTPFPTCVPDSHLRESLCTLPFMQPAFKQSFRAKLHGLTLPSLRTRTEYGARYAALLRQEATARGLQCLDVHTPMLGRDGVNGLINADQNHHLVDEHIPLLLPCLDSIFGGVHTRTTPPAASAMPPPAPVSAGQLTERDANGAMEWVNILTSLRGGQVALKLSGHAVGSYRDVQKRFGPPLPMQFVTPRRDAPGFATWLVKFAPPPPPKMHMSSRGAGEDLISSGASEETSPPLAVVRILGRYRNYDEAHAWLVECSAPALADAVRSVMEGAPPKVVGGSATVGSRLRGVPSYEVPPASFHALLSGRR